MFRRSLQPHLLLVNDGTRQFIIYYWSYYETNSNTYCIKYLVLTSLYEIEISLDGTVGINCGSLFLNYKRMQSSDIIDISSGFILKKLSKEKMAICYLMIDLFLFRRITSYILHVNFVWSSWWPHKTAPPMYQQR